MKNRPTVLCIGRVTIDISYLVDNIPKKNHKIFAENMQLDIGGPSANASRTIVTLGGRAIYVGQVGNGVMAGYAKESLCQYSVEVIDTAVIDNKNADIVPISSILIEKYNGDRTVTATREHFVENDFKEVDKILHSEQIDVVLVDGGNMELCLHVAKIASKKHIPIVLDAGSWKCGLRGLIELSDFPIFSETFKTPDNQDVLEYAIACGAKASAQTRGGKSARLKIGNQKEIAVKIPLEVNNTIDTLGAGDSQHGAFAFGLASLLHKNINKDICIDNIFKFSLAIASLSTQYYGVMGWQKVEELSEKNKIDSFLNSIKQDYLIKNRSSQKDVYKL